VPDAGATETRLADEARRQAGTPPKLLASVAAVTARPDGASGKGGDYQGRPAKMDLFD
jgi:hypothetical protein